MKILNAEPGFSQPMTEDKLYHFLLLEEEIYTLQVLMKRMNQIFMYYFDSSNQKFYIETSKYSKKKNLENNEMIYFLVDEPHPPYKGVRGKAKDKDT